MNLALTLLRTPKYGMSAHAAARVPADERVGEDEGHRAHEAGLVGQRGGRRHLIPSANNSR